MGNKTKKGLLVSVFIILLLPLVQQNLPFSRSMDLYGYADYAPDIDFSWKKWFSGTYQAGKGRYVNDFTGFRADLVRMAYQLDFSLFKKLNGGAVVGKGNCLFYDNYILAYNGFDYVYDPLIIRTLSEAKAVSDTLARLGKSFVLVYCPSKVSYYAENLPERCRKSSGRPSNLERYKYIGDSIGINQIDFNAWFLSLKNKGTDSIMSKQGIHWTNYGALIAGDSLVRYIERLRGIRMHHCVGSNVVHTEQPEEPDADIGKSQNLIFLVAKETYSYRELKYDEDTTRKKPKVIFIGDSFVINLIKNWTLQNTTADWQFWFYFKSLLNKDHPNSDWSNPRIREFDWKSELDKTDCVVMMYTTPSLRNLHDSDGFIQKAYEYYYPKK